MGGAVACGDYEKPLCDQPKDERFSPVTAVYFFGEEIDDAKLGRLKEDLEGLTRLQYLGLWNTLVTDAGLKNLEGLTRLRSLNLMGTKVTDAGLKNLEGLTQLHELNLDSTLVADAGLKHLEGLTQLRQFGSNIPTSPTLG